MYTPTRPLTMTCMADAELPCRATMVPTSARAKRPCSASRLRASRRTSRNIGTRESSAATASTVRSSRTKSVRSTLLPLLLLLPRKSFSASTANPIIRACAGGERERDPGNGGDPDRAVNPPLTGDEKEGPPTLVDGSASVPRGGGEDGELSLMASHRTPLPSPPPRLPPPAPPRKKARCCFSSWCVCFSEKEGFLWKLVFLRGATKLLGIRSVEARRRCRPAASLCSSHSAKAPASSSRSCAEGSSNDRSRGGDRTAGEPTGSSPSSMTCSPEPSACANGVRRNPPP
mmetsp:Transcript_8629/g.28466  ORF Transcript_8629/g.28466 Transcript_8629/m.28466 type:complete len:288 (-) Transcript_8629:24-887(-)